MGNNPTIPISKDKCNEIAYFIQNNCDVQGSFRLLGQSTGLSTVVGDDNYEFEAGSIDMLPELMPEDNDGSLWSGVYVESVNKFYVYVRQQSHVKVVNTITNTIITTIAVSGGYLTTSLINGVVWCGGSSGLTVINPNTDAIIYTAANGGFGATYSSVSGRVYATSGSTVNVFNSSTYALVTTISTVQGDNPYIIENLTNGYLYLYGSSDYISVINPATNLIVTETILPSNNTSQVAFNADYSKLYICGNDTNVYVINTTTNLLETTIFLSATASSYWIVYVSGFFYVTSQGLDTNIYVINDSISSVSDTIAIASSVNTIFYSYNDGNLYAMGSNGNINIISTSSLSIIKIEAIAGVSIGLAVKGRFYYISNSESIYYLETSARPFHPSEDGIGRFITVITPQACIEVTVNGGAYSLAEVARDVANNPVKIKEIQVDCSTNSGLQTPLQKKLKNSSGIIESTDVSLISHFSSDDKQNLVTLKTKDFDDPVLDGVRYLQKVIPANSTMSIIIKYEQVDKSSLVTGTPTLGCMTPVKKIKKYQKAQFRFFKQIQ